MKKKKKGREKNGLEKKMCKRQKIKKIKKIEKDIKSVM
jgi:hypothetical protein